MRNRIAFLLLLPVLAGAAARIPAARGFLFGPKSDGAGVASNSISDLLRAGNTLWAATGGGLCSTPDGGASWRTVSPGGGLGKGSVTAMAVAGTTVWAATVFDTLTDQGHLEAGGGLSVSFDGGETWRWMRQPVDSAGETRYNPTTTHIQNTTWDIALVPSGRDTAVWIASFGGGFRKSLDRGVSWEAVTPDGNPFAPLTYLSHRAFSVLFDGETLWAGSAGGVHKSTDGGRTWVTFTHQNQAEGISGNFVVALGRQKTADRDVVWAATVETTSESGDTTEYRAVSKSEDGGLTWTTTLRGVFPHNFAFDDSAVYASTDRGLFKSLDYGETWAVFPLIRDSETGEACYDPEMNCAAAEPGRALWAGSSDGLARSLDNGISWKVFRAFRTPGSRGEPSTYAYPNPFSPYRHNLSGEDGHVRFQYTIAGPGRVTVRVYDFGMNLVATAVERRDRPAAGSYSEVWDGRNELGKLVSNGVYFFRIDVDGDEPRWGKVIVMD
jgi:hypothetical protein